jgi:hypothetical protein
MVRRAEQFQECGLLGTCLPPNLPSLLNSRFHTSQRYSLQRYVSIAPLAPLAPETRSIPIARSITKDDSVDLTRSVPPEYLADRWMLMHEVNLFKLFRMR